MSILIAAVSLYLLSTVAIGLYASSRVQGSKDFKVAGRSLPLYMNFACVFATWLYEMVQNAYKVTLTMAFVPLAFGVYWTRASTQGAIFSAMLGLIGWIAAEYLCVRDWGVSETETPFLWHLTVIPPQMYGLAASILGMIFGSLAPQIIRQAEVDEMALKRTSSIVGH